MNSFNYYDTPFYFFTYPAGHTGLTAVTYCPSAITRNHGVNVSVPLTSEYDGGSVVGTPVIPVPWAPVSTLPEKSVKDREVKFAPEKFALVKFVPYEKL